MQPLRTNGLHIDAYIPPKNDSYERKFAAEMIKKWAPYKHRFKFEEQRMDKLVFQKDKISCLIEGTDMKETIKYKWKKCACVKNWYGRHCSIPHVVYVGYPDYDKFILRSKPRKIVQSLTFLNEWAMLYHRLYDTGDVVDAFLITEGVYTGYGDPKNLTIIPELLNHSIPLHEKIIPIVLEDFPNEAQSDGWIAETRIRDLALRSTLPPAFEQISNDDIFMYTDADEVPSREALLFLKLHDNIPEPYVFVMWKNVFGFYWQSDVNEIYAGATFRMMASVFNMDANNLRRKTYSIQRSEMVQAYAQKLNTELGPLVIGDRKHPAGYHCSWCSTSTGIRTKLISAINADFPRWGDYPQKCQIAYIESLVSAGRWFTEDLCFETVLSNDTLFAPAYIKQHAEQYKYLLQRKNGPKCQRKIDSDPGPFIKNWHRMEHTQLSRLLKNNDIHGLT